MELNLKGKVKSSKDLEVGDIIKDVDFKTLYLVGLNSKGGYSLFNLTENIVMSDVVENLEDLPRTVTSIYKVYKKGEFNLSITKSL